jgi:hypothetical protein
VEKLLQGAAEVSLALLGEKYSRFVVNSSPEPFTAANPLCAVANISPALNHVKTHIHPTHHALLNV